MNVELLISILHFIAAFLICFVLIKWWIVIAKKNKLLGKDLNKFNKPLVTESGGLVVVISIILTLLFYIFFKTFILKTESHLLEVSILIITLLLACLIGFVDDILGWGKGIKNWKRVLMTIPISIPLMVINAGHHTVSLPFIGTIDFGLFYPLFLIPIGMIGATNGYNILAGYNGLEAGLGVIIFTALGFISFATGQLWLALVAGIIVMVLIAFLFFNMYPAKIFPGDSLTYSLGALMASFAIFGNMEKATILLFLPFIAEGILKARGGFKWESGFSVPQKDNSLEPPFKKIYSMPNLTLKLLKKIKPSHKVYEKEIVFSLWAIEIILAVVAIFVM